MSSHEHSISPLRQRMIEDMTLRKLNSRGKVVFHTVLLLIPKLARMMLGK